MFESFAKVKEEVLRLTEQIKVNKDIDIDVLNNSMLEENITSLKNGEFKIALIAPFSAGKSTFINSLIGQDILSMEITAETSVITKVKFSNEIKLEITYRDGDRVEVIPAESETAITTDELKEILEEKTTVKGENTEDNIKEVKVYYPIEMCKDKVELVDTPGLFARHEKHAAITTNILPSVNAVIFMIDPESVGEQHFTEVIQNYVRNAKNSNMEAGGKHIFFVINKIDNFTTEEIEKAKNELIEVLRGIIDEPQIFEISAYYAMFGKMYLAETIDLIKIQKDRKIKITDPEDPDFTLSGRQITSDNAHLILEESRIRELEKGLEKYLEEKNNYLIINVQNEIENIIDQSIEKKKIELNELINMASIDKVKYEQQLKTLQNEIKRLDSNCKVELHKKINDKLRGGSSGRSISTDIVNQLRDNLMELGKAVSNKIDIEWVNSRAGLNKDNAEEKIAKIINKIQDELEIKSKEVAKETFNDFKERISGLVSIIEIDLNELKNEFENTEIRTIGKSLNNLGNYNLDSVLSVITKGIEREFAGMIGNVSREMRNEIMDAEEDCTTVREKTGFFYKITSFFTGNKKYVTEFDNVAFKRELDRIIDDSQNNIKRDMNGISNKLATEMESSIKKIGETLKEEITSIIKNITNVKQSMINNVLKTMNEDEVTAKNTINLLKKSISALEELQDEIVIVDELVGEI